MFPITSDMNVQYSSLDEVWGTSFPKKSHSLTSKNQPSEEKRDSEKEARVFPTPQHRGAHAVQKHKKAIDDLSTSLPISADDDDSNYKPSIVPGKEHFTQKSSFNKPFLPSDPGLDFPYAPPSFQVDSHELKLNRIMKMLEETKIGYETPATQDMLLYIFTGVFFLFTFDTFVNLGRRLK
jgi:hypothetical protein